MWKGSLPEVFLDTDVAFDIISKREPHYISSIKLLELAAQGRIALLISESSIANLIYLSYDIYKLPDATSRLLDFVAACQIKNGGKRALIEGLSSSFTDKEDAFQYFTALYTGADYFVTRNTRDYKHSSPLLPAHTPAEFLEALFLR